MKHIHEDKSINLIKRCIIECHYRSITYSYLKWHTVGPHFPPLSKYVMTWVKTKDLQNAHVNIIYKKTCNK